MADLVWSCFQGWAPVGSGGDQGCGDQESDCRVLTLKVVVSSDFREPGVVWGPPCHLCGVQSVYPSTRPHPCHVANQCFVLFLY